MGALRVPLRCALREASETVPDTNGTKAFQERATSNNGGGRGGDKACAWTGVRLCEVPEALVLQARVLR